MRGKVVHALHDGAHGGITPAYAGKSIQSKFFRTARRDHPRVCGEKIKKFLALVRMVGSPPRMRGKGRRWPESVAANGITPAYAGKSLPTRRYFDGFGDHPRVCGEKFCSFTAVCRLAGSPPRMRGKVCKSHTETAIRRITPAYAGKSAMQSNRRNNMEGSPPRMRGKD